MRTIYQIGIDYVIILHQRKRRKYSPDHAWQKNKDRAISMEHAIDELFDRPMEGRELPNFKTLTVLIDRKLRRYVRVTQ